MASQSQEILAIIAAVMVDMPELDISTNDSAELLADDEFPRLNGYIVICLAECCMHLITLRKMQEFTLLMQVGAKFVGKAAFKEALEEEAAEMSIQTELPEHEGGDETGDDRTLSLITAALADFPKMRVGAGAAAHGLRIVRDRMTLAVAALEMYAIEHANLLNAVGLRMFHEKGFERAVVQQSNFLRAKLAELGE